MATKIGIHYKVLYVKHQIEILLNSLRLLAEENPMAFPLEQCPLNPYHFELSQTLWGIGCYEWQCKFCGYVHSS